MDELHKKIEKVRRELNEMTQQAGFQAPEILQKSKELDHLLNQLPHNKGGKKP